MLPIPPSIDRGAFNSISGMIYCPSHYACIHEVGHRLDWEGGWISADEFFMQSVQTYVAQQAYQEKPDEIALRIILFPHLYEWSPFRITHSEIYASIYQWADGKEKNVPEPLRKFYDFQRGDELIGIYLK